jgi:hypothetical protein
MAHKFRRKPETVEAMQFIGAASFLEIEDWMGGSGLIGSDSGGWQLRTPEGWAHIRPGEWVIKMNGDEFWRYPDDKFRATYEPVEPSGFIYDEWGRDRSTARPYDEFRAEAGLTT